MTTPPPSKDPLHGVTLEKILTELSAHYGWEEMGRRIPINCFTTNPSLKSSLTFLRKTPWARAKVEVMYRWYREKQMKAERQANTQATAPADGRAGQQTDQSDQTDPSDLSDNSSARPA